MAIYQIAERPLVKSDWKFYGQILEAAASAPRNIAEGFARRTHADFARFRDIARGSLAECQNHLQDGVDRSYFTQEECDELVTLSKRASGAIAGLQRHLRGS